VKAIKSLLKKWETAADRQATKRAYSICLPVRDAARIEALADMYPSNTLEQLITDLISASLDELEASMPYVQGTQIIETDEFGDPIYEDVGPSTQFQAATQKHKGELLEEVSARDFKQ